MMSPHDVPLIGAHPSADLAEPDTLRVMLADGDPLARQLVGGVLRDAPGLAVVDAAADGPQAVNLARRHRPNVLVIESALPGRDGVDVVRELTRAQPETRVVMLCAQGDDDDALQAFRAGAIGYLTKDLDPAELPDLVRKAARGEPVIPAALLPRLLELVRDVPDVGWRPVRSRLTTREWEIVRLLEDGASTRAIAVALSVSKSTVYSHLKSLMRKLSVHSRHDVVAVARRLRREETTAAPGRTPRHAGGDDEQRFTRPT
jgi:DNA-binding NarL/FixJ family response regulator